MSVVFTFKVTRHSHSIQIDLFQFLDLENA